MKRLFVALAAMLFAGIFLPQSASALGLKIAPLQYKASLKENEQKQGVIDISNPSTQAVKVTVSVQGFRQVDDNGSLQFYDDKQLALAIKPELTNFELGPREALRLYFTIDGTLLPKGDVYAAIFLTTEPAQIRNGVGQLVRVGTLISVVNKTPGARSASITGLDLPLLQLSDRIDGSYRIKNTGSARSGFYPTVRISAWPEKKVKQVEGSLVFGGHERSNDFSYMAGFGIHRIEVGYGNSTKSQWVITVAPAMLIALALVVLIVGIELLLFKRRRKIARQKSSSTS